MPNTLIAVRIVHIVCGVYWAGAIFFFITLLEPSIRALGPEGGRVTIKLFERGYLTVVPLAALLTCIAGIWLLWTVSAGFQPEWMASRKGITLSLGGALGILALTIGAGAMRPSGIRLWKLVRELPTVSDESVRNDNLREMQRLRNRLGVTGRIVFWLVLASLLAMSVARYL